MAGGMGELSLERIKRSVWFRFLRYTDWFGLPADAGVEPPSKEREIEFWSRRSLQMDDHVIWDKYAYDPRLIGYSKTVVEGIAGLSLPEPFTVHELGSGMGRNGYYLWQRFPNARITGNDVNPFVREKCRRYFGAFADALTIDLEPTQDWLERAVREHRRYDVVFTCDHLVHFPDDSVAQLAELLPQIVGRYLVLKESYGIHAPESRWYRHWTTHSGNHWFDRDYTKIFTNLDLVYKRRLCLHPGRKVCALYVFQPKRLSIG